MVTATIRVAGNAEELAQQAADKFAKAADDAIVATGRFAVALSGGNTPRGLYRILAEGYAGRIEWGKVHILFTDERCVPAEHADSNFGMICRLLLDQVPVRYEQVYRMAGEKDAETAAAEYDSLLAEKFGKGLDLVVLGVGADAHTASLFPQSAALAERSRLCVATYVEKKNSWRLTMTAPYFNRAFEVMVLASGKEKAAAVQQTLEGMSTDADCPIQLIKPASGHLLWLMDAEAAGMDFDED